MSSIVICAPADSPLECEGTSYDRSCSRCNSAVMLAPSGQEFVRNTPDAEIVCIPCYLFGQADPHEFDGLAGDPEKIVAEIATARPNMRRYRN